MKACNFNLCVLRPGESHLQTTCSRKWRNWILIKHCFVAPGLEMATKISLWTVRYFLFHVCDCLCCNARKELVVGIQIGIKKQSVKPISICSVSILFDYYRFMNRGRGIIMRATIRNVNCIQQYPSLYRLHYITSTNCGLCQGNMTWCYNVRGSDYHWITDLYERLALPVLPAVVRACHKAVEQRMTGLNKQKTVENKHRRIRQKMARAVDQEERKRQAILHSYGDAMETVKMKLLWKKQGICCQRLVAMSPSLVANSTNVVQEIIYEHLIVPVLWIRKIWQSKCTLTAPLLPPWSCVTCTKQISVSYTTHLKEKTATPLPQDIQAVSGVKTDYTSQTALLGATTSEKSHDL